MSSLKPLSMSVRVSVRKELIETCAYEVLREKSFNKYSVKYHAGKILDEMVMEVGLPALDDDLVAEVLTLVARTIADQG